LIDRPALRLPLADALQQQRLTLLLAPAGWGKTSALAGQGNCRQPERPL
jgi:LuxR family transcriptional regulator, maltose regulon positive regulatory protein